MALMLDVGTPGSYGPSHEKCPTFQRYCLIPQPDPWTRRQAQQPGLPPHLGKLPFPAICGFMAGTFNRSVPELLAGTQICCGMLNLVEAS
ncbi:hypothetical protein DSO57_1036762 [Entomophthora muscae]|uniref:Uncharacterized protein n=1 Tax=Entomophthora muscae TaxID=34485 RepID=A0ACC2SCB2_9FUNG|nr:hypothetical protein DSO57_1036762 [Entomophthora muscae]